QANTLLRFEALIEEHDDLIYACKSCKDVKACYKECKKELTKAQSAYDEKTSTYDQLSKNYDGALTREKSLQDRLKELEEEKKEMEQLNSELDKERYTVKAGNGEMVRHRIINQYLLTFMRQLHQSAGYKRSLGEAFSLAICKGFIDGISIDRKDPNIRAILKATPNVNPTSSDIFMETYEKLFDKRYPYVKKVARMYLLDPSGLQNVMPDKTGPTPSGGPRDTPTASYA
ncbi:V-type proton ATPase subunit B2, partial [Tanacetum coccineum]